jgi:hypothetical protein
MSKLANFICQVLILGFVSSSSFNALWLRHVAM